MVVNREFPGDTPVGMTFSTLAGSVGGGKQTPGFMGCGKVFLTSRKFLLAEGGHRRIVWMPKELKDPAGRGPRGGLRGAGRPGPARQDRRRDDRDHRRGPSPYLEKVGHPALTMDPLF